LFSFEAQWQTQHDKPLTPPSEAHLAGGPWPPPCLAIKRIKLTLSHPSHFHTIFPYFRWDHKDKMPCGFWHLMTQQLPSYLPSLRISIIPNIMLLQLFRIL
jgi:hypothetical protein